MADDEYVRPDPGYERRCLGEIRLVAVDKYAARLEQLYEDGFGNEHWVPIPKWEKKPKAPPEDTQ